jgi:hypothetical protein
MASLHSRRAIDRTARWLRRPIILSFLAWAAACGQTPPAKRAFNPALVKEQQRRIAAFDSVVRSIDTDSAYTLWHASLTEPDVRLAELRVLCEYDRINYRYGRAAFVAITRMEDTLWRHADPKLVVQLERNLVGPSPSLGSKTCDPMPSQRAPNWLRDWYVYELPRLPPAPEDTGHTR